MPPLSGVLGRLFLRRGLARTRNNEPNFPRPSRLVRKLALAEQAGRLVGWIVPKPALFSRFDGRRKANTDGCPGRHREAAITNPMPYRGGNVAGRQRGGTEDTHYWCFSLGFGLGGAYAYWVASNSSDAVAM